MTTLFTGGAGEVIPITGIPINPNTINPIGNAFIFLPPFLENKKAGLPVHFGNPAVFEPLFCLRYRLLTTSFFSKSPAEQKPQRDSTRKIQRSVAFRSTLTGGLALSENKTYFLKLRKACQQKSKCVLMINTK
jgi:hypothetical protein